MDTSDFDNEIERLEGDQERLRRTIELALQSVKSLELSALSAERVRHGHISSQREAWIRTTVRSKDQVFLDSLYNDLEGVTKKIASLTPAIAPEPRSEKSQT